MNLRSDNYGVASTAHQVQNPMFRLGALVHGRSDILHLEFGEPDFPTPAHIVEAAQRSLRMTRRQGYGPSNGLPSLREAIAARVARVSGFTASPEQIIVTPGGTGALMASSYASPYQATKSWFLIPPGPDTTACWQWRESTW